MSDTPALVALLDDWYESGEDGNHDNLYLAARALERLEKERDELAANARTDERTMAVLRETHRNANARAEAAEKRCKAREGALIKIVNLSSFHDELETARVIANAALAEGEQK